MITIKKIETGLLYALIFAIPFQIRLIVSEFTKPFNEWTNGSLFVTDVLLIALLLVFLVRVIKEGIRLRYRFIEGILDVLLLVALISLFGADNSELGWFRFMELTLAVAFFWYVRNVFFSVITWERVALTISASALVQAIIGIV